MYPLKDKDRVGHQWDIQSRAELHKYGIRCHLITLIIALLITGGDRLKFGLSGWAQCSIPILIIPWLIKGGGGLKVEINGLSAPSSP